MNAQAILTRIEEDAREAAARVASEATARAAEWTAASRDKIEAMHQTMLAQANRDGDELEQRMLRMAELDQRKALLQKKRQLIDEAFAKAGAMMQATTAGEKRAFFLKQLVHLAEGGEMLMVGRRQSDWYDDAFIADANRALIATGKRGDLKFSTAPQPDCVGFILAANGTEIRCTFDALLEEARMKMEQQVAAELFQEPDNR